MDHSFTYKLHHACALPLSPQRVSGSNREFLHLAQVAVHFIVAGHRRHFKFGVWVEHSR